MKTRSVAPNIRRRETKSGPRFDAKVYNRRFGKSVPIGTYKTLREAKLAQGAALLAIEAEDGRESGEMTVAMFVSDWLETSERDRSDSTKDHYRQTIKQFVRDFGSEQLRDLNRVRCKKWAGSVPEGVYAVAKTMLNEAMADGYLDFNPLSKLGRKKSRGRKDLKMISSSQLSNVEQLCLDVLGPVVGPQIVGIIRTSAYLGLRKCEAFACAEDWFRSETGNVFVRNQMGKKRVLREPKTGTRRIAVTPQMIETLRTCEPHPGPGPLFRLPCGKAFTPSSFNYYWKQVAAASQIEKFQFHELRHYHATWLKYQGVPTFAIAVQLGHGQPHASEDEPERHEQTEDYIHDGGYARDLIRQKLSAPENPIPYRGRSGAGESQETAEAEFRIPEHWKNPKDGAASLQGQFDLELASLHSG